MSSTIGSLFSGYRGLDMAVERVTGARTAWCSDVDPGAARLLDHHWPDVPNLGDITAIDWLKVEPVTIMTGGFPCTDLSTAGKRAGMNSETRSGLWSHMAHAILYLRPSLVVIENVRGLLSACAHSSLEPCPGCVGVSKQHRPVLRAAGRVVGDLAGLGYDARWVGLRAADVGAPHGRFRVFIVAHPNRGALWQQPVTEPWSGGQALDRGSRKAAPDAGSDGRERCAQSDIGPQRPELEAPQRNDAERRHEAVADADGPTGYSERPRAEPRQGDSAPADTERGGCPGRSSEQRRQPVGRNAAAGHSEVDWGDYGPAVRRWERITRLAPAPTETGPKGGQRLAPRFVEWMQGLPAGHVTSVPDLSRNDQLKLLGNGVVPQQAEAALRHLLTAESMAA